MRHGLSFAAALVGALLLGCGGGATGASTTGASVGVGGSGGGGGAGVGGSGAGGGGGSAPETYPDLVALHDFGIAPTCSLNGGVCHGSKEYPELTSVNALLGTVGQPCQLGYQDPALVLDECEVPGDTLQVGGADVEILYVEIAANEPFPPKKVTLDLAATPASLDPSTAKIRRVTAQKVEVFARLLNGVVLSAGSDGTKVVLDLGAAADPALGGFLDTRAWHGDRVRMGDANHNGKAHTASAPWAEVYPGDPARSMLYQRLISDKYGPVMPLIPRTWTPDATRALWCWIRGLPPGATPDTLDAHDAIVYATCPADPNAPDPNAAGGWPAVKLLVQSKCATAKCHDAQEHSAGLDLTPTAEGFAKNVIDVGSSQAKGVQRVAPGQPAASYLLCKADPACASRAAGTGVMPFGQTMLSALEIKTISAWILDGAKTE